MNSLKAVPQFDHYVCGGGGGGFLSFEINGKKILMLEYKKTLVPWKAKNTELNGCNLWLQITLMCSEQFLFLFTCDFSYLSMLA